MFHVKPKIEIPLSKKGLFMFIGILFCISSTAQKDSKFALTLSGDYGFGAKINNHASTISLYYTPIEKIRVVPTFTYFFKSMLTNMQAYSINIHYLRPDLLNRFVPFTKTHDINLYPLAGVIVSNRSKKNKICNFCDTDLLMKRGYSYSFNFGFDFGFGIEYKIPTMLPFLKDALLGFEMQYHILDNYERPVLKFGFIYNL